MRTNLHDLFRMAVDRAEDATFLEALKADPRAAISQTFGVTFVETGEELSDDELDQVVGGTGTQWLEAQVKDLSAQQNQAFDMMLKLLKQMQEQKLQIIGGLRP